MDARRVVVLILSLSVVFAAGAQQDEILVEILDRSGGGCNRQINFSQTYDSGEAITLNLAYCNKEVRIWAPDHPLTYDIDGELTGQIIINAKGMSGTWDSGGEVKVGSGPITLTGDEYTNTAASLGGGESRTATRWSGEAGTSSGASWGGPTTRRTTWR